jgi:hypothetical protein
LVLRSQYFDLPGCLSSNFDSKTGLRGRKAISGVLDASMLGFGSGCISESLLNRQLNRSKLRSGALLDVIQCFVS